MDPADKYFDRRIPQPKSMSSAQWETVKADVRERAFFMARVAEAEVLDLYKKQAARVVSGEISPQEFRRQIREGLTKLGYHPPKGKEGTIHDLSSFQRQNVVMETNVQLAYGYANYHRQFAQRAVWPAKQMIRLTQKREPRDWHQRWKEAAGTTAAAPESFNAAKMAALIDSPIWADSISRFGNPYPIYDFNSGMGDRMLDLEETEGMGIAVPKPIRPKDDKPTTGFNDGLKATPRITDKEVKDGLAKEMDGLADFVADELVWRDPNGTKPLHPKDVAGVIGKSNNADIPLRQRDALADYQERGPEAIVPDTAQAEDFRRLVHRIEPSGSASLGKLTHGQSFPSLEEKEAFLAALQARQTGGWDGGAFRYPVATRDVRHAVENAGGAHGVVMRIRKSTGARDTGPAAGEITGAALNYPEVFWIPAAVFVVAEIIRRNNGPDVVTLEEQEED